MSPDGSGGFRMNLGGIPVDKERFGFPVLKC